MRCIALLLAAIGIFGVMANLVGERTREIGVRLAMGARREDVLGMILRPRRTVLTAAVCIGLAMAFALAHMAADLLRGVQSRRSCVFTTITVGGGGSPWQSWIPARRAAA